MPRRGTPSAELSSRPPTGEIGSAPHPSGRYAVKTDRRPTNLVVGAPGFVTTTVAVTDSNRFSVVNVDLQRSVSVAGAPIVSRLDGGSGRSGSDAYVDSPTAPKLQVPQALYDRGLISDERRVSAPMFLRLEFPVSKHLPPRC